MRSPGICASLKPSAFIVVFTINARFDLQAQCELHSPAIISAIDQVGDLPSTMVLIVLLLPLRRAGGEQAGYQAFGGTPTRHARSDPFQAYHPPQSQHSAEPTASSQQQGPASPPPPPPPPPQPHV